MESDDSIHGVGVERSGVTVGERGAKWNDDVG